MNRRRIFLIAAVALTLLLTVGSGLVLRGQEEYVPENQVAQMDPERSQVYLSGSGYSVNKDQKKEHQEIEKQRKQKQQHREPSQQQKQQARAAQRAKDGPKTKGPGDDPGGKDPSRPKPTGPTKHTTRSDPTDPSKVTTTKKTGAEEDNEKLPKIKTSLVNGEVINGARASFWVTVIVYQGRNVPVYSVDDGYFEVTCNGVPISSTGASGNKTSFRADLKNGKNVIVITAHDRSDRTTSLTRRITANASGPEEVIGIAYVGIIAPVLGLGDILGCEVELNAGDSAKDAVQKALKAGGITPTFSGSYLAGLSRTGIAAGAYISDDIRAQMEELRQTEKDPSKQDPDRLKEKDFYESSGWIYLVNGEAPEVGLNSWPMEDGDELLLVFSLAEGVNGL